MTLEERIRSSIETRRLASEAISKVLKNNKKLSEVDFQNYLNKELSGSKAVYPGGWYDPPPGGAGVLFASEKSPQRLAFDSLRKEEFWPKPDNYFEENSVGMIYFSPLAKETGMIGDLGFTLYNGGNEKIKNHIKKSLEVLEKITEEIKIGMKFSEVYFLSEKIMNDCKVVHKHILPLYGNSTGKNFGHTFPWSYQEPTELELQAIESKNFGVIKKFLEKGRVYINEKEDFVIPDNVAFTVEMSVDDKDDPSLPSAFFHMLITFINGVKEIHGNFNQIFDTVGMNSFIQSNY